MSASTVPLRLRRGFSDEAVRAFADLVTSLAVTTTDIEAAIQFRLTQFSTAAYSVDWATTEKFAWLFMVALKDADAAQQAYWLEYVRNRVLDQVTQQTVQVA